ncbi:phospholipase A and acyltransferase 4-like [Scomber scombrus]|uniref:Phospholipase A and acyltransferase 4-like n=1 Tax=Scomber scombrus TaxID=13677 RepID=A0AAV1P2C1_SCOSC
MISKSKVVQNLKPGDLIEIFRDNFQHWAVYVGNGYVVELVVMEITSSGVSSAVSGGVAGAVRKIKLQDVVNRDKWQKNNAKHPRNDNTLKPRPEQEIVNEALSYVGKDMNYTVATWNCEHFATWCRYGTGLSLQVKKTVKTASGLGVLGLLGSFVSGAMISNVPGSYSS